MFDTQVRWVVYRDHITDVTHMKGKYFLNGQEQDFCFKFNAYDLRLKEFRKEVLKAMVNAMAQNIADHLLRFAEEPIIDTLKGFDSASKSSPEFDERFMDRGRRGGPEQESEADEADDDLRDPA